MGVGSGQWAVGWGFGSLPHAGAATLSLSGATAAVITVALPWFIVVDTAIRWLDDFIHLRTLLSLPPSVRYDFFRYRFDLMIFGLRDAIAISLVLLYFLRSSCSSLS